MKRLYLPILFLIAVLVAVWFALPPETDAAPDWQSYAPPIWTLGPIQGADGKERGVLLNLDQIDKWNLPIKAFHFDAPDWMSCTGNAQFGYSETVLNRMRTRNIRGLFWIVPLIGEECAEYKVAADAGYFVTDAEGVPIVTKNFVGKGSWIDFNNPAAVAYWHGLLDQLRARVGDTFVGFYTDSVRPDLVNADNSLNPEGVAYGEAYSQDLLDYTRAHVPDGDVVFKRFGKNSPSDAWLAQNAHIAYVNDLPTTYNGMKVGIMRVFDSHPFIPLAYNELSGYSNKAPDTETYIRRFHWGAFQPVMENVPKTLQPWAGGYPTQLMQVYRYYATLHSELVPYLHSYDQAAYEDKTPIFRDIDLKQFSARLGNEIFVKYVTEATSSVRFKLPPGEWVNYWNESQVFEGNRRITYPVPLGKEPILIQRGAIIPMDVRNQVTLHGNGGFSDALTLNVYPIDHSTFRYHDRTNGWLTFDVSSVKQRLSLCMQGGVPSQPVIWRIASVRNRPNTVTVQNGAVGVNAHWGDRVPKRRSLVKLGKAQTGWFYDANDQRLYVKLTTLGTDCPAP